MELVDTHCHLQFEGYDDNRDTVYNQALKSKVTRMICVGTTLADSRQAIDYAQAKDGVWATAGVHPHEAGNFLNDPAKKSKLAQLAAQPKVVAIGELGLDFYKNYSPKEVQEKALRLQIEAGLASGLPFVFHVRDSWSDFWRIFDEYSDLHGVIHSFSSGPKQLNAALDRGLYIGLNGIMTFTKDKAQLEAARQVPLDKLLLETDAPFLTPAEFRGQTCEPKHLVATAQFLANLRQEPFDILARASTNNALKLFNLQ